jgi:DNA-binding response OmpR family regulator
MKILIIEDEKGLAESISAHLGKEGFLCEKVYDYNSAIEKINLYTYECIIVDINLPDGTGFDLIEALKKISASTGIIIISARNSIDDKIRGLEIGSDDYLIKPFHLSELNARLKSLLRRRNFAGSNEIVYNEILINLNQRKVYVKETETHLSKKEYDLLLYFISNKDNALTKASIAEHLWGDNIDSADSFDIVYSQIKNLRRKLLEKGANDYLHSIYGVGYKFGES